MTSLDVSSVLAPGWLSWRVFPGFRREVRELRRWLSSLLPDCPERSDLLGVASELGTNALEHSTSGHPGGCFTAAVIWHRDEVVVAVADGGGQGEPRVVENLDGEGGRGLLLVRGLSARIGWAGNQAGRVVWAAVAWPGSGTAGLHEEACDPGGVAVGHDAAPGERTGGALAWPERSSLISSPHAELDLLGYVRVLLVRSSDRALGQGTDLCRCGRCRPWPVEQDVADLLAGAESAC